MGEAAAPPAADGHIAAGDCHTPIRPPRNKHNLPQKKREFFSIFSPSGRPGPARKRSRRAVAAVARRARSTGADCAVGSGEWAEPPHSPWTLRRRGPKKGNFCPFFGARESCLYPRRATPESPPGPPRSGAQGGLLDPPEGGPDPPMRGVARGNSEGVQKPREFRVDPGSSARADPGRLSHRPALRCRVPLWGDPGWPSWAREKRGRRRIPATGTRFRRVLRRSGLSRRAR